MTVGASVGNEESDDILWIYFEYERLPNFCFMCGKLGHTRINYEEVEERSDDDEEELKFGEWLHASPFK